MKKVTKDSFGEKVILAFSGGLDTSFCAAWLAREKNLEVHGVTIDTGGFSKEELETITGRAHQLQLASFTIVDGTDRYYDSCIRWLVAGNVLKNGTYPLSVSAERVVQAMLLAEYAKENSPSDQVSRTGIYTVAHGSTGAGNDQVRFDMLLDILLPGVQIITPVRDLRFSREEEIAYLKKCGFEMDFQKAAYSINRGI